MAFLGPNNAIAWAHFRLRGGWKRSILFSAGAAIVVSSLIYSGIHFDQRATQRLLAAWNTGLLAFQTFLMVLYIPGRISGAVRGDIQTKVIESHRLMPTTPLEAVAGYVSGAALQPLVLSATIFLIGVWTTGAASMEIGPWAMAHIVLLGFALFVWLLSAYASFTTKLGPALIFGPMFFGPIMTEGGVLSALPGLMVILSPVMGQSIFTLRSTPGQVTVPAAYAMALAAQLYFAGIFFVAAARRYRSVDGVGIGIVLGLLLVAGWVGVTFTGMRSWEDYRPRGMRVTETTAQMKVITATIVALLLSLTAVAASAWANRRWRQHRAQRDPSPMRRPIPSVVVIVIATALIALIPFAPPLTPEWAPPRWITVAYTALIVAMAMAAIYFLCAWVYLAYHRAGIAILIWVLLTWGAPIVIDLIRYGLADYGEVEQIDGIASCSPIGALIVIWDHRAVSVIPGIVMQALIALLPLIRWMMVMTKRRARWQTISPGAASGAAPL